ncbi:hypothetical protein F5Y00DRAFT_98229 [Daldinia vernicosa]|uniref:uncharacterized protein n=1 Tax=Daldinia vernicosa TaxID=114800 RepID=UPI0020080AC6|nr:uncharacterized protein F5Y00DRAFT_98229 [Daldinia vernicosa]KAI0848094.1 hypothetical protein F5Y00DRAFT_98229 [Daldinia vernicosa]
MEKKDNNAIRRQSQHPPRYTLNPFIIAMGFTNPLRAHPPSRHPETLGPKPTSLPRTTSRQVRGGLDIINVKDDIPNSAKTEATIDSNNSPSGGPPICRNAPSGDTPSSLHLSNSSGLRAAEWRAFPPEDVPRFDLANSTTLSEEKLPDIERLTNKHITQSITFRKWLGQKNKELDALGSMEQPHENSKDEISADHTLTNAEQRKPVIRGIRQYFVDTKAIEAARRQASETLQHQRRLPLTATKCLLGSDGSSSNDARLTKEKHLYMVGSPPDLVRLPFDQAVDAGLEVAHPHERYALPDPPGTLRTPPPPPQASTSGAPSSTVPSTTRRSLNIPEWFEHFKIPLRGKNREARWNNLMNHIYLLETEIRLSSNDEASEKTPWDKKWHDPNDKWPFEHQQKHGGWWKCRSGPDAPEAEKNCRYCHYQTVSPNPIESAKQTESSKQTESPKQTAPTRSAKEKLDLIQSAIDEAMAIVGEKDKAIALKMLRKGKTSSKGGE